MPNHFTTSEGIQDNLRFLVVEVQKQLDRAEACLKGAGAQGLIQILASDDYIDNLTTLIQSKTFARVGPELEVPNGNISFLKAYQVIAVNLERISDFCERLVDQLQYVEDEQLFNRFDHRPFFIQVRKGVREINRALHRREHRRALAICQTEERLDALYTTRFRAILKELTNPDNSPAAQTLVTALFISHYLERMGDSLLNIGEAILSACLGERIRYERLDALENALESLDIDDLGDVALSGMGETKSGTTVAALRGAQGKQPSVILKEGKTKKLREEQESVERWNALVPGLAPRIYDFQEGELDSAAVFEYVPGMTFEDHLSQSSDEICRTALSRISETLASVWTATRTNTPVCANYTGQMRKRLADVWAVHPDFGRGKAKLAGVKVPSLEKLVSRAAILDERYPCPFSCMIHGDFNADNMLYDSTLDEVRFIDLHRSKLMDYVQDVSVFLVSNLRLQIFEPRIRTRIERSTQEFYHFAGAFAEKMQDTSFEIRLALGMARSFATSTRFVLDETLARTMFHRSRYLLERLLDAEAQGRIEEFKLPKELLID